MIKNKMKKVIHKGYEKMKRIDRYYCSRLRLQLFFNVITRSFLLHPLKYTRTKVYVLHYYHLSSVSSFYLHRDPNLTCYLVKLNQHLICLSQTFFSPTIFIPASVKECWLTWLTESFSSLSPQYAYSVITLFLTTD